MKLKLLAIAFCCSAVAACGQAGEGNAAEPESSAGATSDGMGAAGESAADTLGNQLNQLQNIDAGNAAENGASNAAENTGDGD